MNAQNSAEEFPSTASILAIAGGCLMILAGIFITAIAVFVIPHIDFNSTMFYNYTTPYPHPNFTNFPGFAGSILAGFGLVGLVCGVVVIGSGFMIRVRPDRTGVFGLLILVFSVLSFFGTGGLIIGAILGIVGGIMTLRWRAPVSPPAQASPPGSVMAGRTFPDADL